MRKALALLAILSSSSAFAQVHGAVASNYAGPKVSYYQTPAPTFPVSASFIWSPKAHSTIAALETPVGHIDNIQFGKMTISPTAFVYLGADTNTTKGAGGFGLRLDKSAGPSLFWHVGVAYGTVIDSSPHFGLELGVSIVLSK